MNKPKTLKNKLIEAAKTPLVQVISAATLFALVATAGVVVTLTPAEQVPVTSSEAQSPLNGNDVESDDVTDEDAEVDEEVTEDEVSEDTIGDPEAPTGAPNTNGNSNSGSTGNSGNNSGSSGGSTGNTGNNGGNTGTPSTPPAPPAPPAPPVAPPPPPPPAWTPNVEAQYTAYLAAYPGAQRYTGGYCVARNNGFYSGNSTTIIGPWFDWQGEETYAQIKITANQARQGYDIQWYICER